MSNVPIVSNPVRNVSRRSSLRSYKRRPAFLQMQAGDHGNTNPPLIIDYVCHRFDQEGGSSDTPPKISRFIDPVKRILVTGRPDFID